MAAKKKPAAKKPKVQDYEGDLESALRIAQALGWLASKELKNGKVALRIGRLNEKFSAEVKKFEEERIRLVKEFGYQPEKVDDEGNVELGDWKVRPENLEEFEERFKDMREEPVKIVGIVKIDFSDIERTGLPGALMVALDPVMIGQEE